jgi:hypothetical protein
VKLHWNYFVIPHKNNTITLSFTCHVEICRLVCCPRSI